MKLLRPLSFMEFMTKKYYWFSKETICECIRNSFNQSSLDGYRLLKVSSRFLNQLFDVKRIQNSQYFKSVFLVFGFSCLWLLVKSRKKYHIEMHGCHNIRVSIERQNTKRNKAKWLYLCFLIEHIYCRLCLMVTL